MTPSREPCSSTPRPAASPPASPAPAGPPGPDRRARASAVTSEPAAAVPGASLAAAAAPVVVPAAVPAPATTAPPPPRLLDQLRRAIRVRHYSIRTEAAYVDWVRRFILFHDKRHPRDIGAEEVARFLTHLAVERNVAPATQGQARSALLFLYRVVLNTNLPWLDEVIAARNPRRLPVVLTPGEVRRLLAEMNGSVGLLVALLYGTGMRLLEGLRLRVKDIEFERREIVVRSGKGGKDRVTVLPENLVLPLQEQLARARALHQRDLAEGHGSVWLPHALAEKYPHAAKAWGWQWVFPATRFYVDPETGSRRRHHLVGAEHPGQMPPNAAGAAR